MPVLVSYARILMGELFKGPGFRTCSHPVCSWPAIAAFGYDYGEMKAWIKDLGPEADPATYELCSVHCERFKPPKGWEVEDRRRLPEPLFDIPETVEEQAIEDAHAFEHQQALPEV